MRRATARATTDVPLRPNRVHPLWRTDHNNNCGIGAPEIEYAFHPDADWIELTTVHKGGLFGSDYRMLFPGDGIDGIKRFYLDTLIGFGKRGLACQPAIVGVGCAVAIAPRGPLRSAGLAVRAGMSREKALFALTEAGAIILDLKDMTLTGQEGIDFLTRCEASNIALVNCDPYVREWITRQQSGK